MPPVLGNRFPIPMWKWLTPIFQAVYSAAGTQAAANAHIKSCLPCIFTRMSTRKPAWECRKYTLLVKKTSSLIKKYLVGGKQFYKKKTKCVRWKCNAEKELIFRCATINPVTYISMYLQHCIRTHHFATFTHIVVSETWKPVISSCVVSFQKRERKRELVFPKINL